jgi:hypothetical protein
MTESAKSLERVGLPRKNVSTVIPIAYVLDFVGGMYFLVTTSFYFYPLTRWIPFWLFAFVLSWTEYHFVSGRSGKNLFIMTIVLSIVVFVGLIIAGLFAMLFSCRVDCVLN